MRFTAGDSVISTVLPPLVYRDEHTVGSLGVVREVDPASGINGQQTPYLVDFGDDDVWWCSEAGLESALPSVDEVLRGLAEILTSDDSAEPRR